MTNLVPRPFIVFFFVMGITLKASASPWILFSEIHYQPLSDSGTEYIELWNSEPPRVNLGGWRLSGEIQFEFPEGFILLPGQVVVIAKDPKSLAESQPDIPIVLGPFQGKFDNGGGEVELLNAAGGRAARMRYGRGGRWTSLAAGTGHSLELNNPYYDPLLAENWVASSKIGGTPGQVPVEYGKSQPQGKLIIREGDFWRYQTGDRNIPNAWYKLSFNDTNWRQGPSGFGYSDGDDRTIVSGIRNRAYSVFTRKKFNSPPDLKGKNVVLKVDYDDGFAAYINGVEVARANLGSSGTLTPRDFPADGYHEAGQPERFDLGPAEKVLRQGQNVIAAQIHNHELTSTDLTLIVELILIDAPESSSPGQEEQHPVINEVNFKGSQFIEIFNPSSVKKDISGYFLSDEATQLKKYELSSGTTLEPFAWLLLNKDNLGGSFSLDSTKKNLYLTHKNGDRVLDHFTIPKLSSDQYGRVPDGSGSILPLEKLSPQKANLLKPAPRLVINEIYYSPVFDDINQTFVELYNLEDHEIALKGFKLSGGINFEFSDKDTISPKGFVVVAKNPQHLKSVYKLSASSIVGPFKGRLSGGGENLSILDSRGLVVDEVAYSDRHPWPSKADGGGSLELLHPNLDNSISSTWSASEESKRSQWQEFSYTQEHSIFRNGDSSLFQLFLLSDGTCLVDDFSITNSAGRIISEADFDDGERPWNSCGTHERSRVVTDPSDNRNRCYQISAIGRGNARTNYVYFYLNPELDEGQKYTVKFRAKWIEGSPLLLTRTAGQGLAHLNRIQRPSSFGTPGKVNSTFLSQPIPSVSQPEQYPVVPTPRDPVRVQVKVSSVNPIKNVYLHYRKDQVNEEWKRVSMVSDSRDPSQYRVQIPPQGRGKILFYVSAIDENDLRGTYPSDAPSRTALYAVGLQKHPKYPTYTVLVSQKEWRNMDARPTLSNYPLDATLVFGDSKIFYNVQFRRRGSPFTRPRQNWRLVFGHKDLDGRRSLTFDAQNGGNSNLSERLTFWLVDQLRAANSKQRFVHVNIMGHGSGLFEDVEKVDSDFLERWFEPKTSLQTVTLNKEIQSDLKPLLHKVDDYWELSPPAFDGFNHRRSRRYIEAYFEYQNHDPEIYRWNFPARLHDDYDDFEPLMNLIEVLDPSETANDEFIEKFEQVANADAWLKVLAARTFAYDWDSIGLQRGKNAYLYRSPYDGRWYLLPWDADLSWQRSSSGRIYSRKFPAVSRLLSIPQYQRQFLSYLAYLCSYSVEESRFRETLQDLSKHIRSSVNHYEWFASSRTRTIQRQLPRTGFNPYEVKRQISEESTDTLIIKGTAPILAQFVRLEGRTAPLKILDLQHFEAKFPMGPEGGEYLLDALDVSGRVVSKAKIKIDPRPEAKAIATVEAKPAVEVYLKGVRSEIGASETNSQLITQAPKTQKKSRNSFKPRNSSRTREVSQRKRRPSVQPRRPRVEPPSFSPIQIIFMCLAGMSSIAILISFFIILINKRSDKKRRSIQRKPLRRRKL